jgi:hypothetical protein
VVLLGGLALAVMRAICLTGGNASGKTTVLREAQDHLVTQGLIKPAWVIYADLDGTYQVKGPEKVFRTVMRQWVDPTIEILLIEGVRIYSAVLRCLTHQATFGVHRALKAALLLREDAVGAAHIRARCERRGKTYNAAFWDSGKVTDLFSLRYTRAFAAFKTQHPAAPLKEVKEFWIGPHYAECADVAAWLDAVVKEEW